MVEAYHAASVEVERLRVLDTVEHGPILLDRREVRPGVQPEQHRQGNGDREHEAGFAARGHGFQTAGRMRRSTPCIGEKKRTQPLPWILYWTTMASILGPLPSV